MKSVSSKKNKDSNKTHDNRKKSSCFLRRANKASKAKSDSVSLVEFEQNDIQCELVSTRITRSKKMNESEFIFLETKKISRKKTKSTQSQKEKKIVPVSNSKIKFQRNDICFAKLRGHLPWPAQVKPL